MTDLHKIFAFSTVATAPSPATSGTSLVVASGDGALFPAAGSGAAFYAIVFPAGAQPTPANAEIIRATGRSTDTLSPITRARLGSSARSIQVGDQIIQAWLPPDIEPGSSALGLPFITARASDSSAVNNSSTLVADDTLLLPVSGNSSDIWYFEAKLLFTTGSLGATSDVKIGWTVPSGTTMKWSDDYVAGASGAPGSMTTGAAGTQVTTYTAASTRIYPGGNGADVYAYASGWIYVGGTSGNVNLTFAQNTPTVDNLKLQKGSLIRWQPLVLAAA